MKKLNLIAVSLLFCLLEGCSVASRDMQSTPQTGNQPGSNSLQVNLAWTSNRGEQQGFYVEESSDGVNFSQILNVPDGTNSALVTLPSAGKVYYFRIRGYNQAGNSPYTAVVSASS